MEPIYYVIIALGVLIIGFILFLKTKKGIGIIGEFKVKLKLGKSRKNKKYVFNNYMVVVDEKSSQIDHIVINKNGVFVIETKNYAGRIYGNDEQQEWLQVLSYGRVKNKFYNPVKQNYTHICRLKTLLPENTPIKNVVVFVQNNTKFIKSDYTYNLRKLRRILRKKIKDYELDSNTINTIYKTLRDEREKVTISNRDHIKEIENMKKDIQRHICPRCHGRLVLRTGRDGNKFYGCSNYPRCTFTTKKIEE